MDKKTTRTESLHLRLTPSEMKTLRRGARLDERTLADWARRNLLNRPTPEERAALLRLLDADEVRYGTGPDVELLRRVRAKL